MLKTFQKELWIMREVSKKFENEKADSEKIEKSLKNYLEGLIVSMDFNMESNLF